jgi:hypothetical protein
MIKIGFVIPSDMNLRLSCNDVEVRKSRHRGDVELADQGGTILLLAAAYTLRS